MKNQTTCGICGLNCHRTSESRSTRTRFGQVHRRESRRGVAAVELALVTPFLLVLTLGICELGQALKVDAILSSAACAACTAGTRPGSINADVISDANAVLTANGLSASSATVTILVNDVSGDVSVASQNDKITVTVSMPTSTVVVSNTLTYLGSKPTISQTVAMLKQG